MEAALKPHSIRNQSAFNPQSTRIRFPQKILRVALDRLSITLATQFNISTSLRGNRNSIARLTNLKFARYSRPVLSDRNTRRHSARIVVTFGGHIR
jgi:hypothetical protein